MKWITFIWYSTLAMVIYKTENDSIIFFYNVEFINCFERKTLLIYIRIFLLEAICSYFSVNHSYI